MSDTCCRCGHTNRPDTPPRHRRLIVTVEEVDESPLQPDDPGPEPASDYCSLCVIGVLAEAERYGDAATLILTPQTAEVSA
jgi:hypothetical protein